MLPDQDRTLWDGTQIQRGMSALEQAHRLGGGAGNYASQAAIVACHMRARTAAETDWERIVPLYDALMQTTPSPIVALNRAVAVGMAQGPALRLMHSMPSPRSLLTLRWLAIICFTVFAETSSRKWGGSPRHVRRSNAQSQ